jgi:membrane-associated phospholipid phosphatase
MSQELLTRQATQAPSKTSPTRWFSRWPSDRVIFVSVLSVYVALTAAVVVGSPLDALDHAAAAMKLSDRFPHVTPWVFNYVIVGQRGPSSVVAAVYLAWRAWRMRSWRPPVMLASALVLLNVGVGVVKLAIGRLGPSLTIHPRAVFEGGDIFPSGHTSNAVVIFGVLAIVAVRYRRAMISLAVVVSTTIGLGTVFLDTHWVTDVLGGWLAGILVLLVLPAVTTRAEMWLARVRMSYAHRARISVGASRNRFQGQRDTG